MRRPLFRSMRLIVLLCLCFIFVGCTTDFDNETKKSSDKSENISATPQPTSALEDAHDVTIKVEFRENIVLNKFDVKLFLDGNLKETLPHGKGTEFETKLTKGEHLIRVESEKDPDVFGELKVSIIEDCIVSIYVRTESKYITVEERSKEAKNTPTPTEEPMPSPTETPVPTETPTPTVEPLHTFDFTSNDDETAKKGNSGEYSYVVRENNSELYFVFDFDSGYAYLWTVEDDSQFYVRIKIVSGDLNSGASVIGYIDPDKPYTIQVKCKYAGDPSVLVGSDGDGNSSELIGTSLENAHKLMNQRMMVDASKKLDPTPTPSVSETLDFTNNDAVKALSGASGLFAYSGKENSGANVFMIFDLDKGYVYYFTDKSDEEYYARFLIESGNLKEGAVCKIFNASETITWNVKFRRDNSANEVEIAVSTGANVQVKGTNLNSALELMQTKYMLDRSIPTENVPTPSPEPTATPTLEPTNTPTPLPTNTPTPSPTPIPTNTPTPTPIPTDTPTPTPKPTNTPTPTPKQEKGTFSTSKSSKEAKEGKTGLFAYESDSSSNVFTDVLINFDDGYVDFVFNNGSEEYAVRGLIMEGNLNDGLIVVCFTDGEALAFAVHFKWANMYENLVVVSQNGLTMTYAASSLSDLKKRISKMHIEDCRKK